MDVTLSAAASIAIAISIIILVPIASWVLIRVVNWVWLRPKKLEKCLREYGFSGNPYRLFLGDMVEFSTFANETKSRPIKLTDDIAPHVLPYFHHIIHKYGKNSFVWFGPNPRLNIIDPDLIKEIFSKHNVFQKPDTDPLGEIITGGLFTAEGEKWTKHRKIINPAFHLEKLKNMVLEIYLSCSDMINKWEMLVPTSGSAEVDVWPYIEDLSGDVISRTAFGSNNEEGRRIFQLQKEQVDLALQLLQIVFIPGWRFIPTRANRRMKEVICELQVLLRGIINKREKAMEMGEVRNNDLLGILMESNSKEIQEHGIGLSIEEVIAECKLFYFGGSGTTSSLLVWTMILLSQHPNWQARAREEVFQVFGNERPDFDGLNRLKIVTMILHEVLRLYPSATFIFRAIKKATRLGTMNLPAGVQFTLPILLLHHDSEIWGEDTKEFKPERFSEGVVNATKGKLSFIPFGGGPRICIGQNFSMIEAKVAIATILRRFSFELSPSYTHAPFPLFTLQPQHGAQLILHKLN